MCMSSTNDKQHIDIHMHTCKHTFIYIHKDAHHTFVICSDSILTAGSIDNIALTDSLISSGTPPNMVLVTRLTFIKPYDTY